MSEQKIVKNIGINYINMAIMGIISFLNSVIFSRMLGPELYGVYTYANWFIAILGTALSFGLAGTLTKFVGEYYFNDKKNEAKKILNKFINIQAIVVIIISIIMIISINLWGKMINLNFKNRDELLIVCILTILPTLLNGLYISTLSVIQRFDITAKISIIANIVLFVCNIIVVAKIKNIVLMIIVLFIISILQNIALYINVKRILRIKKLEINIKLDNKKRITKYAISMYINVLWQQVVWAKSEYFFLALYGGLEEVGVYGIAYALYNAVNMIFYPAMVVINNYFSKLVSQDDKRLLNKLVNVITKYFTFGLIVVFFAGITFGPYLINILYSNKYSGIFETFIILLFGFAINQILNVSGTLTFLYERKKLVLILGICSGIINITLDVILIPKLGVVGAAIANIVSQFFYSVIHFSYVALKFGIKVRLKEFLYVSIIPITIFLTIYLLNFNILIKFMVDIVAMILIMISLIYMRIFNKEDLEFIKKL